MSRWRGKVLHQLSWVDKLCIKGAVLNIQKKAGLGLPPHGSHRSVSQLVKGHCFVPALGVWLDGTQSRNSNFVHTKLKFEACESPSLCYCSAGSTRRWTPPALPPSHRCPSSGGLIAGRTPRHWQHGGCCSSNKSKLFLGARGERFEWSEVKHELSVERNWAKRLRVAEQTERTALWATSENFLTDHMLWHWHPWPDNPTKK